MKMTSIILNTSKNLCAQYLFIYLQVGLALVRALLYVARPPTCKLGKVTNVAFRDVEQYPGSNGTPGILILKLGSPIYFPNSNYVRER